MIINTQFYQKSFPRVLCFILMKDILYKNTTVWDLTPPPANQALIPQQHVILQPAC